MLAVRRYDELTIRPYDLAMGRSERAECWLRDDVCSVVASYVRRAEFRRLASWHRTCLAADSKSEERAFVNAIDAGLVEIACRQAEILQSLGKVWRLRKRSANRRTCAAPSGMKVVDTIMVGSRPTAMPKPKRPSDPRPDALLRQCAAISDRPWKDLVCPLDYLWPAAELNLREPNVPHIPHIPHIPHVQDAAFLPFFNPNLRVVGDLVARCMKVRTDCFEEILCRIQRILREKDDVRMSAAMLERSTDAWRSYRLSRAALDAALSREPEASLREACVTLVQVYAAYRPQPELDWLGLSPQELAEAPMRKRAFQGQTMIGALDRVASGLRQLGKLDGAESPAERMRSDRIATKELFVDLRSKQIYWKGNRLSVNWTRALRCFELLCRLAEKAKLGAAVNIGEFFEYPAGASAFSMVRRRLHDKLPADLDRRIVTVRGESSYRLDLESHQVDVSES